MMKYKGYLGTVAYDDEAEVFYGSVIGIKDVVTFQGRSVDEIKQAFKDSVNDYLAFVKKEEKSLINPIQENLTSEFLQCFMLDWI